MVPEDASPRSGPDDHRLRVAAAVVVHEGRVLLVRRRMAEGNLSWQFPAGKVEPGETWEDAAVRETKEETGLDVSAAGALGERVHPMTGRLMSYAACDAVRGSARAAAPTEIAEVAWVTLAELPGYIPGGIFEPVQRYLEALIGLPPPGQS
ncbi:NUDIX hydrolase [Streptomyces sp. NBC_00162]|uniref:NUDIX hydrolase n=1 Tax=Streptomyces sp. NBC_00162 TaxID=2903629 RepID=UPI00214CE48E|nr:NUDIX hydrolase [Streptomyces sp. NBC_00162]UUU38734.1 NUDIX hydrolase [Streptomyces sp. NBC_00162]